MSLRRVKLIANGAIFRAKMEQAAGEPIKDQVTQTHLTEDIPKVSTNPKEVIQNQVRGRLSTYVPARCGFIAMG